ncbi:hypothetical protein FHX49_000256 [Microbacterium endophyticum]|uniref:Uncharacterized protein n=1 Tax=Microbacterium endophyticum TaxID=1526412 RepID=A0A7W4V0P8_9MICO|nr:hypothetical protein [Microbacterium endophyticum]MBB2974715.1 hypothetical protein [Microbacterium endophyticum]NIK37012.1 hypothetical protein [Microbacterium endophyticum]
MAEKNTRKESGKTAPAKTLKEKRQAKADKKAVANRGADSDVVARSKKR